MTKNDASPANSAQEEMDAGTDPRPAPMGQPVQSKFKSWLEIASVIMLAIVAIATPWNSYQAARWSSLAGIRYGQASARRLESTRASTTAGQQSLVDVSLFTNWINAYASENDKLIQFYQKRFRDEFKPAFEAWMATDPANNPDAPSSPFAIPEYVLEKTQKSIQLEAEATHFFSKASRRLKTALSMCLIQYFWLRFYFSLDLPPASSCRGNI